MKHRETHPTDVPGCFACKLASLSFSAVAMPTRRAAVVKTVLTDAKWDRDMAAYKRLRADGLQPRGIDGCARLEREAQSAVQVERAMPDRPFVKVEGA